MRARAWIWAGERCSTYVGDAERVDEAGEVDVDDDVEVEECRWARAEVGMGGGGRLGGAIVFCLW